MTHSLSAPGRIPDAWTSGGDRSPYENPVYLDASAAHEGSHVVEVGDGARLTLLRQPAGVLQTVYGYPRPVGDADLEQLAGLLCAHPEPVRLSLSPLGAGAQLAELLRGRMQVTSERSICVTDLEGDPVEGFHRRARRATLTAVKRGAQTEVSPVADWFGAFYRAAMRNLDAHPLYLFADDYFAELAAMPHYQVTVRDDDGVAAAALFLHAGEEAYYHLGGRRGTPDPVLGAMNLALCEGMREAARRRARIAVLGGGRGHDTEDPLLVFKRQMSTRELQRPTLVSGAEA